MRLIWLLPLALVGCTLEVVLPDGDLPVGRSVDVALNAASPAGGELRPSAKTYRVQIDRDGAFQVAAVSSHLQQRSRLRLTLKDAQGVVQAQSVARNWFGLPQVALASCCAVAPQGITSDPGYRLNFKARAGDVFYVKVENLAEDRDRVTLSLRSFPPNPSGQGEAFTTGTKQGAIEFLGEFDRYNVSNPPENLYLRFTYTGPLDLVALLYTSPTDSNPVRLDSVVSCAPVSPAVLLVVRDRGLARAGFDEPGSGQYTLALSSSCP
ncbi:MAG: hypothetical protein C4301_02695 [Thermus sp.]|uniref:hypothetical protein n=1 Tax=Thermus sp. TaxID=275 RepID=UPI00331B7490